MVERGGLENRCAFWGTKGSNPLLSAIPLIKMHSTGVETTFLSLRFLPAALSWGYKSN